MADDQAAQREAAKELAAEQHAADVLRKGPEQPVDQAPECGWLLSAPGALSRLDDARVALWGPLAGGYTGRSRLAGSLTALGGTAVRVARSAGCPEVLRTVIVAVADVVALVRGTDAPIGEAELAPVPVAA